ncbi:MAG TPA: acetyl-CoA carboxylase, biotin carboxyl carrier protein, partial [Saprospiraceae bacterium]|nr:acetyl-CoA carboxylase, biotin carboxyl carrier protein [Saprospiraceae bacterium]
MNNFKEIQELLRLVSKLELSEFKMKDGEFEMSVRTRHFDRGGHAVAPVMVSAPAVAPAPAPAPVQESTSAP